MLNFLGKVVVPPGTSRNNTNNTAAYLAGTGNYNATVAAYPASAADGAAGNLWTFAVTGDSGTGVRITVNPTAKTILVLYQTGVSTVTLVNAEPKTAPFEFGGTKLNIGEIGFVQTITAAGAVMSGATPSTSTGVTNSLIFSA